jgi:hypothetical protein
MKRQELKFEFRECFYPDVKQKIATNFGAKATFDERIVTSIYYDNHRFDCYHMSNEGIVPRAKYRVRWYGSQQLNTQTKVQAEVKKTFAHSREKLTIFEGLNTNLSLTSVFKNFGLFRPVMIVSYLRQYYESSEFRLTLDRNISGASFGPNQPLLKSLKSSVLEVKCPENYPTEEIENKIASQSGRFSKYCALFELLDHKTA